MKYYPKKRTAGDVADRYQAQSERARKKLERALREYQIARVLDAMTQRRAKLAISIARALKEENHGTV